MKKIKSIVFLPWLFIDLKRGEFAIAPLHW
jgi:hypothetical protein